jgi:hypothetical protein
MPNSDTMHYLSVGAIHDACFRDLNQFEDVGLSDAAIGFKPMDILSRTMPSLFQLNIDKRERRWVDWPDAITSKDSPGTRNESIAKCINHIEHEVAKSLGQEHAPRRWSAKYCNALVPSQRYKCRPDLVLVRTDDEDTPDAPKYWNSVLAVAELKSGASSEKAIEQLARHAQAIFEQQPDRRHVLGLSIGEDTLLYVLFNRSGAFASDEFNIHDHPERFIRVVAGMMFAGRETIGLDPTMKFTVFDETEPFEPYIEVEKTKYTIMEVLHVETVIRGRATAVYKVKNPKTHANGKDEYLIVKNGWVDLRRKKENDILMELSDVPYIPRVVGYHLSGDGETSNADFDDWCSRNPGSAFDTDATAKRVDHLQEVRVAMTPVGTSITDFRSLKELVHVFLTIVDSR